MESGDVFKWRSRLNRPFPAHVLSHVGRARFDDGMVPICAHGALLGFSGDP